MKPDIKELYRLHRLALDVRYVSTRGEGKKHSAAEVIKKGLADDGGLFVPERFFPLLTEDLLEELCGFDYADRAAFILSRFLPDYKFADLLDAARAAYSAEKFGGPAAPIARVGSDYLLELWHGPTSAFKDMALQIMPRLLSLALDITGECRDAYILVATSGDTGKAALEGYKDVPRVKIKVFYPVNGVSNIQKKQMSSQTGENVDVVAINGNFDDAQTGVKRIFSDENCRFELAQKGWFFSSANSINWGRLVPQIVYYISAYCDLLKEKQIKPGEKIDIVVPTGNFGNIFAAYAAKQMLLPVGRLVCASNRNDVLADFINTGVYDKRREFFTTVSPSMDILVSSNLERLLYWKFGAPAAAGFMKELAQNGFYKLNGDQLAAVQSDFSGFSCTEEETKAVIAATFKKYGYLCDTHTAVALGCAEKYRASAEYTGGKLLIASTASPYKFAPAVLSALGEPVPADDFAALDKLHEVTKVPVPGNLAGLKDAPVRFTETVDPADMQKTL